MRISTNMIYEVGVGAIGRQTSQMLQTQQQLATGRRVLTPADDPVASAGILETSQGVALTKQYTAALDNTSDTLALAESQLQGAGDLLIQVRTLAVQAGNSSLSNSDRQSIATQMRASFEQLMGIANTRDASGQYIFSGFQGNTQPFAGTVNEGVAYAGDDGQRFLQVSPSQQLAVSDSGNEIFNHVPSGNGVFATDYGAANVGTGIVNGGNVLVPSQWQSPNNSGNLQVSFWTDTAGQNGPPNTTYYDLVDAAANPPVSLFTGTPPVPGGPTNTYSHAYVAGQPISFSGLAAPYNDFGVTVTISGKPASGDSFSVKSSSGQSVFATLGRFIKALERPLSGATDDTTRLGNEVASMLGNVDQAHQSLLTTRAAIGARMGTADALQSVNGDVSLQYQQTLSRLQDVDVTQAISDLTRLNTQLQAAQQSFVKISQLSLFNYLG
ncbi:MAG: flagellar hook-associated protein FlgL [Sterolibacterium sp.]|jgi:flagellar hook-associated protein 3 FlgL|nr:flagellar hook-associated protein FlgL [Sterolibacterium sp.]